MPFPLSFVLLFAGAAPAMAADAYLPPHTGSQGCWASIFDGKNYQGARAHLTGPTYLEHFKTDRVVEPYLKDVARHAHCGPWQRELPRAGRIAQGPMRGSVEFPAGESMKSILAACAASTLLTVSGCGSLPDNIDEGEASLLGAAGGATLGAVLGDGGIIAPALGALGGVVIAEEAAEDDESFDPDVLD